MVDDDSGIHNRGQNVKLVQALVEAGADVNDVDPNGFTPLAVAAYASPSPIVQMLLEHHAHVNTSNNIKRTPLHLAVMGNNLESAKLLLEYGAEVNAVDADGWTPLYQRSTLAVLSSGIPADSACMRMSISMTNAASRLSNTPPPAKASKASQS